MSTLQLQMRRTGWDVVLGALLVVGGLAILGDAAFATTVSVKFIGWVLLLVGLGGLGAAAFRIGKGGFWSVALSGGVLTVLGLFFLRNTQAAALTLTLIAGTIFLTSGIVRLVASAADPEYRVPLLLGGVVSTVLGLIVLFNLFDASYVLVGVLLGIQVLVDGLSMILVGRWHVS
jgi:membrane protein HdeD